MIRVHVLQFDLLLRALKYYRRCPQLHGPHQRVNVAKYPHTHTHTLTGHVTELVLGTLCHQLKPLQVHRIPVVKYRMNPLVVKRAY